MLSADIKVCAICGINIPNHEDLYEDLDKLKNIWTFHKECFNRFNNKNYKKPQNNL